ncbi:hypothetical protein [Stenotrophomonas sp. AS1]|uniref:hypothetical protein n=1 Tax=Stenotrophomonas sp. AS1 TaxID=3029188 RepID=UPI00130F72AF
MTPSQADAIAQAILRPDTKREAVQQRQRAQAQFLARQRVAVGVGMFGMALGTAAAIRLPMANSQGMLVGGALFFLLAHLGLAWRERRRVARAPA